MVASRKWTFQEAHRGQAVVRLIVRVGLAMSPKARRRNASMHIKTVGNLLKQLLSYVMLFLSGFAVFVAFPLYILGHAFDQKNLLQLIWSWPSLLTVMLWGLWVRGFRMHRESFAWQIIYFLFVICSLRIIELQYDWSEEQEMANALFCLMELMFVTALLVLEIIAWLNRRKPVRNNEFEINAWRMLSYLLVFFLLGGLMNVIPGMTELIQKEDVGKAMIALLVISYPLEILNIFWNAIENDGGKNDSRNTENEIDRKLDDLCVKVQNSLDDSQQKIVESVRDIDEKISKVTSDTPCMSFRRTDSTYEFKVVMRRQNHRK
ncbi:hypothetical protein BIFDEN_02274 [Bifidobacterium dentium ATCC 27678]|nr:hypothetical protein BIFDEN_02274 [Bifidobacterium dentium ATCC 27678]